MNCFTSFKTLRTPKTSLSQVPHRLVSPVATAQEVPEVVEPVHLRVLDQVLAPVEVSVVLDQDREPWLMLVPVLVVSEVLEDSLSPDSKDKNSLMPDNAQKTIVTSF